MMEPHDHELSPLQEPDEGTSYVYCVVCLKFWVESQDDAA